MLFMAGPLVQAFQDTVNNLWGSVVMMGGLALIVLLYLELNDSEQSHRSWQQQETFRANLTVVASALAWLLALSCGNIVHEVFVGLDSNHHGVLLWSILYGV